ncbi:RHS repeat domain-containing protein, partial [Pseudomonas sp.]|uniref:RHS repeat domain-containing protein n=1 Tax=Pseudomonas sp. TaxID=306 RepID=UPI002628161D
MLGESGESLATWDGRGSQTQTTYDNSLRPTRVTEQATEHPISITECITYGDSGSNSIAHNQCGQVIRHDDPAGTLVLPEYSVFGAPLIETRRFLSTVEAADWPDDIAARNNLLESENYVTASTYGPIGEPLTQLDVMGNHRQSIYTVSGQLKAAYLRLAGTDQPNLLIVSDIRYNAFGQTECETAGNGVVTTAKYNDDDGRLLRLTTQNPDQSTLQDMHYAYDPVGNILTIEDAAQPVRYFNNQQVEPISRYRYDSLYQLIEASGREVITGSSHGSALPDRQSLPPDPNQMANYTQTYDYDAAGNLLEMRHVGAQSFTRTMLVALDSNRSLPESESEADFAAGFDANGNLQALIRGQVLSWDVRNQLRQVTAVSRDDGPDDCEIYVYDGGGQRCRKVRSAQTVKRTLTCEVRYLPGIEIRTDFNGEVLHVITMQAGSNNVRVLHWVANKPANIPNDQLRYSLSDHLGSSALELDDQAGILSHESYYPFGGTAWWAAKSTLETKYKTIRYSGKERDATGLYYYGFRYYAPWLQRWINPDSAGAIQGLNLFGFVGNAPIHHIEVEGHVYKEIGDKTELDLQDEGISIVWRGLAEFRHRESARVKLGLYKTETMYQNSLSMINAYPQESAPIMRSYFGYEYPSVTRVIADTWQKTKDLVREYQEPLGHEKIVGMKSPDTLGIVDTNDAHGRVAINILKLRSNNLSITLGHEISHLGHVSGFNSIGPSTEDYFYIFKEGMHHLIDTPFEPHFEDVSQNVSEIIMGAGMTVDYLSIDPSIHSSFISGVGSVNRAAEPINTIEEANRAFNRSGYISS